MKLLLSFVCATVGGALLAPADYLVSEDLGALPIGDTDLVNTTAGGPNNSIFPKFIFLQGSQLNFGTEYVYEFELAQPTLLSLTTNAITNNPDFFLLRSLATSLDVQSGKVGADGALDAALLDNAPPQTYFFQPLTEGTYYLAIESYDGPDGFVFPADVDFDVTLNVEEAIAIDFADDIGHVGRSNTPIRLDTAGSAFNTELALYDFDGMLLAENDDDPAGGTTSALEVAAGLPDGIYYAVVAGNDTTFGPFFALDRGGDTGDFTFNYPQGPTIGAGQVTGTTDPAFAATEAQWFIFGIADPPVAPIDLGVLASPGERFAIDTRGSDFDTQLALYDAEGFFIDFDDDIDVFGGILTSELDFSIGLAEGEYFFAVADFANFFFDGFGAIVDPEYTGPNPLRVDDSFGGDFILNYPGGDMTGSLNDDERQWYRFEVKARTITITDVDFDPATNEFTVAWTSTENGPFNIFAGTDVELAALGPAPNNLLPTQVAAGASSPTTFAVPAGLQGSKVFFQITD